jgi:peptidoglycan/xylan/chitin deacetylase (PgdA/CDA1 family)
MILLLISVFLFIFAILYIIYKPPSFVISQFQRRWPDVLWSVSTQEKIIALTIDDAPSEFTSEITSILADNDAHATFFVIGAQVSGRETILRDLVRAGHELGNHAMRDEASRSLPERTLVEQIHEVEDMIREAYDDVEPGRSPPRYFRPGSGLFSDGMRAMASRLGYRIVLGSIYPHDPQIKAWRVNAAHILSMVKPGGIIICHDRRSWTAPMLREVLPKMREMGYRIVSVTELLGETMGGGGGG